MSHCHPFVAGRQAGIALATALIALVMLTLSALALMRSVDTGLLISGNLAFKRASTNAADIAIDDALTDLAAVGDLTNDDTSHGYYASTMEACDLTGNRSPADLTDDVNWDGSNSGNGACNMAGQSATGMPSGYTGSFIINRICATTGAAGSPNRCAIYTGSTGLGKSSKGLVSYGKQPLSGTSLYYYRITTRVAGPRNTVSYVQVVVAQ